MPIMALAIGAGAGLLKSELVDRPKEARQRKLAAETQRYSPWTGMQAGQVQEADPMGSALAFGAAGAQVQGGMAQQDINKKLADRATQAPMNDYNYSPYGGGGWQPKPSQDPYSIWGSMNGMGG
jgi:hypothetical protein